MSGYIRRGDNRDGADLSLPLVGVRATGLHLYDPDTEVWTCWRARRASPGTMLTGPAGVDPTSLTLGKNSLLGG